ncbi:hypothetical protein WJX79_000808 [Trebouxia sp. C0005]
MSTEVCWIRQGAQQAISNIQASGDAAGVVRVIAAGTSGLSKAVKTSRKQSKLYWWDEVPAVLQFNPYIKSGYRAGLTRQECVGSLFHCHNETGNIWVHLALLLGCMSCAACGMIAPWPLAGTALLSLLLPVMLCLTGSVIYHTLMANHWNYKTYITIDVCGVFALFLSGAHNFICPSYTQQQLMLGIYSLLVDGGANVHRRCSQCHAHSREVVPQQGPTDRRQI